MRCPHFNLSLFSIASIACLFSACSREDLISSVDLIPVQLESDGKWSMLNREGEIVYADEFKNQPSISINGVFSVEEGKDGTYALYTSGDKPKIIKGCDALKSVGCLRDGLIPVAYKNSRITIIDKSGDKKFELEPVNGKEVTSCDLGYSDGMLAFEIEGDKYGFADTKGNAVIAPKFDVVNSFSEGLALVATRQSKDNNSEIHWQVINKKGETAFKLKKDFEPQGAVFIDGFLPVKDTNDRILMFNPKGDFIKLPSKVTNVSEWNDKVIVFRNDDSETGVIDYSGEIIIRAKYESISLMPDGRYLCYNGDYFQILNSKGEQEIRFEDYNKMIPLKHWGILAEEKSTTTLLDFDGKAKCKEEFEAIGLQISASGYRVNSDYFDPAAVANALTDPISDKGVGKYELGQTASTYLRNDSEPSDYSWSSTFSPKDLKKEGFRYEIECNVKCTANIAEYASSYGYDYSYRWNPESKIGAIMLEAKTDAKWTKKDCNKIYENLKTKGFKDILPPSKAKNARYYTAALKKGKALVCVVYDASSKGSKPVEIGVFDTTIQGMESEVLKSLRDLNKETGEYDSLVEEITSADSIAVDTTVVY